MDRSGEGGSGAESTIGVGLYSTALNLLLVALKLGLAAISGSLALTADAIHSLVDVFGSLIVLAGLLIYRQSSRLFTYGLYKVAQIPIPCLSMLCYLRAAEAIWNVTRTSS